MIKIKMSKELWQYTQETHVGQAFCFWPKNLQEEFKNIFSNKDISDAAFEGLSMDIVPATNWLLCNYLGLSKPRYEQTITGNFPFHFSAQVEPEFISVLTLSQYAYDYLTNTSYLYTFSNYSNDIQNILNSLRRTNGKDIQYLWIRSDGGQWQNLRGNSAAGDVCIKSYHYRLDPTVKVVIKD